jgi:hypothetical protein
VNRAEDIHCLLAEGTSFHPVTGGGVIFNGLEGRLYALNPAAALTWLCLRDGFSQPETTLAIASAFSVDSAVAVEWLQKSMEFFRHLGLVTTAGRKDTGWNPPPREMVPNSFSRTTERGRGVGYRLFGECFRISAPAHLQTALDSLLKGLRVESPKQESDWLSSLQIDIVPRDDKWDIIVDERFEASCEEASVAAEVERLVVQAIVPATPHLLTLHAAALQWDGRTFIFAGRAGVGKTTLSVALARAGWSFGSDELVLLGGESDLQALPFPPCIKADTFSLVETWFPELRTMPQHHRYGRTIKYLQIESVALAAGPCYVVFPQYDPDGRNEIRPLESFQGLQTLLEQCVFVPSGFRHEDVQQLLEWHSRQRYLDLVFNDCDAAVTLLSGI